jgi:peptidoglycan/LPS O-acetylase OafA/YrhL
VNPERVKTSTSLLARKENLMQVVLKPMAPRDTYLALDEAFFAPAPAASQPSAKDMPLEAIRGVAAISVVLWHAMLGFFPEKSGFFPQFPDSSSLAGEPWFGLVYGTAAITLFFVLSGYVLTRRYFETHDGGIILRGILKRWPRLAGPVLIVVMASWSLFALHAYAHVEAAAITKSPWLSHFANVSDKPFTPGFFDAINQGVFATFFYGESYYDSSLWTMRYEFGGSFIAFGAALALGLFRGVSQYAAACALGVLLIFLNANGPAFSPFVVGVGLAYFLPHETKWPPFAPFAAIALAIYLFGFSGKSLGAYGFFPPALGGAVSNFHILASLLLISAVEHGPQSLRRWLSGRVCAFLGALSFPIYLVHVLVICSAGSAAIVWANGAGWSLEAARGLGVAVTLPLAVLAALPLIAFNTYWVGAVNRFVARMVMSRPA